MSKQTHDASIDLHVQHRLWRLEKSNRRLRLALIGAGIGLGGLALAAFNAAQPANREIVTSRVTINGKDGQPRIMMQGNDDGGLLVLYGPAEYRASGASPGRQADEQREGGEARQGTGGATGAGGFVALSPRARLQITNEHSRFELLDPDGRARLVLNLDSAGPTIKALDEDGNEIAD